MRNKSQFRRISGRGSALLTCPVCSKEFNRPHAHLRGKTSCCSYECSRKIKPKRTKVVIDYICQGCGKPFQRRKGYSGPGKYCSRICRCKYAPLKKDKHHKWKGGVSERIWDSRKAIKDRFKEIKSCERCGSSDNLQGHHKKSYADHPELRANMDNIEILCTRCHADEHPRLRGMIYRTKDDTLQK